MMQAITCCYSWNLFSCKQEERDHENAGSSLYEGEFGTFKQFGSRETNGTHLK